MNIPQLTQTVLLDKGQAELVGLAVDLVQGEIIGRDPMRGNRMSETEALSLKPMSRLLKRLDRLAVVDRFPGPLSKPHRVRVEYDQMVVVRRFYQRLLDTTTNPDDQVQLKTALGQFHQPSLNLENHIKLLDMDAGSES